MGLLIKNIIILFISILLLAGCAKSLIKIAANIDEDPYPMFGKTASRNFYVPVTVSDSLVLKWESDAHGSFTNSSVTIYDKYVFTSDLGGRIYVFDIEDGNRVGMLKNSGAVYTSPLVFKKLLIFGVAQDKDNLTDLIYYDYWNGNEVFNEELSSRIMSEMIVLEDGIIFLTRSGRINRYDFSGSSVWQTETDVRTRCSPSLKDGIIIFGNDDGEVIEINLEDGEIIKRLYVGGIFTGTPTIDDNIAYISNNNGKVYSINIGDGEKIWEYDTGARILMSPAVDEANVIIGNLSGALFSINKFNGGVNWNQKYKGLFNATPLLTQNRIIIPDLFRSFYILDKRTGRLNKKYLLEGRVKYSPVFFDNVLFIGFDRGIVRAYEFVY